MTDENAPHFLPNAHPVPDAPGKRVGRESIGDQIAAQAAQSSRMWQKLDWTHILMAIMVANERR